MMMTTPAGATVAFLRHHCLLHTGKMLASAATLSRRRVQYSITTRLARLRLARRRLANAANEQVPPSASGSLPPPPPPPKKRLGLLTRLVLYATALTASFYAGSTAIALGSNEYREFFTERVPFGERIINYTDSQGWDRAVVKTKAAGQKIRESAVNLERRVESALPKSASETLEKTKEAVSKSSAKAAEKTRDLKGAASEKLGKAQKAASEKYQDAKSKAKGATESVRGTAGKIPTRPSQFSEGVEDLVNKAETALKTAVANVVPIASVPPLQGSKPAGPEVEVADEPVDPNVYPGRLPVGFEPPPGYTRPKDEPHSKPKSPTAAPPLASPKPAPPKLPLLAPEVSSLTSSEPIIGQLASTIDALTALVDATPTASSKALAELSKAKVDLTALAESIERIKADEKAKLEKQLEEQAQGYNKKLQETEMSAQERFDTQEEGWRTSFDNEKEKVTTSYKEKLDAELEKQSEIINDRLKAEIISQGIDLQRKWMRDIKVRVEQEREGRLSKLEDLASSMMKLERLTLDNSTYLDDNLQLHALWSSLRALHKTLDAPVRRPFRDELRVLRNAAVARDDALINSTLEALESSSTPDVGIEPFADLATWFSSAVVPNLVSVALVPDQNAGVLSHLAARVLSTLQFRRTGLVQGEDVLSVVARAEYHLNEKNLEGAAGELNQLRGTPKMLLEDWLVAARRRLEVQQAIEVIQAQATLSSLLVL